MISTNYNFLSFKSRNLGPRTTFKDIVLLNKNPKVTKEKIKDEFGKLGVDIFEGRENPSILTSDEKKQKTLFGKLKNFIKNPLKKQPDIEEYHPNDLPFIAMLKYLGNKEVRTTKEIYDMFGNFGLEELHRLELQNMVKNYTF